MARRRGCMVGLCMLLVLPAVRVLAAAGSTTSAGYPGDGAGVGWKAPVLQEDTTTIQLPAPINDVCAGCNGRYLILYCKSLSKLVVFDVSTAKISGYVSVPSADIRFTAGAEKLIVAVVDQKVLQRWDLASLTREVAVQQPFEAPIRQVVMGGASLGPLLTQIECSRDGPDPGFRFVDPTTFGLLEMNWVEHRTAVPTYLERLRIRASPAGELFGMWRYQIDPAGLLSLVRKGRSAEWHYEHSSADPLLPDANGRVLFAGDGAVYNGELRRVKGTPKPSQVLIPSMQSGYYLSIATETWNDRMTLSGRPTVYAVGSDQALGQGPALGNLGNARQMHSEISFVADKRIWFMPQAKLIVTIPTTDDRLVIHRFDPFELLEKSGIEYFYVASVPPPVARQGSVFRYLIDVRSRHGGVKFELGSAPAGMTISPAGVIDWVPATKTTGDDDVVVIVSIRDARGQEIFHCLRMAVR